VNEHEIEPVRGLPQHLPAGEAILWQGSPDVWSLARRGFHVGDLAIYFLFLEIWHVARLISGGGQPGRAALAAMWMAALGAAAISLLIVIAWLIGRTTVYTITNGRLVIRFGVALPMTINLPFAAIDAAGLRLYRDGSGDIPLSLAEGERISFPVLWPHVRPWRLTRAEPMLRSVPEAAQVARVLAQALVLAAAQHSPGPVDPDASEPADLRPAASIAA
jgi:hypothetical protein